VKAKNCLQFWKASLSLIEGTCDLDGIYINNYSLECGAGVTNCPFTSKSEPASFVYRLRSENFCAAVSIDVGITGNMRAYEDIHFDEKPVLKGVLVNRRAYFLVKVNSDLNLPKGGGGITDPDLYMPGGIGTVVEFAKVDLLRVTIMLLPTGDPLRIWEDKQPVDFLASGLIDYKTDVKLELKRSNGTDLKENEVGFSFILSRELAFTLPKNGKIAFNIVADVEVAYQQGTKKRFALAAEFDQTSFNQNVDVSDDGNGPIDTTLQTQSTTQHGSSNAFALFTSMITILLAMMI